jgi:hypothetical protein
VALAIKIPFDATGSARAAGKCALLQCFLLLRITTVLTISYRATSNLAAISKGNSKKVQFTKVQLGASPILPCVPLVCLPSITLLWAQPRIMLRCARSAVAITQRTQRSSLASIQTRRLLSAQAEPLHPLLPHQLTPKQHLYLYGFSAACAAAVNWWASGVALQRTHLDPAEVVRNAQADFSAGKPGYKALLKVG